MELESRIRELERELEKIRKELMKIRDEIFKGGSLRAQEFFSDEEGNAIWW